MRIRVTVEYDTEKTLVFEQWRWMMQTARFRDYVNLMFNGRKDVKVEIREVKDEKEL